MQKTNLNINPYYDDYDENKGFHQILFKPGLAVQARELTQLQDILRNQIERFGNHVFRHGSMVIPGNSYADLYTPYVAVDPMMAGQPLAYELFMNRIVIGSNSGVKAVVKKIQYNGISSPTILYLSYSSGGTDSSGVPNGNVSFDIGESIYLEVDPSVQAITTDIGVASLAHVNKGVYYINGSFVLVTPQSVVMDQESSTPSCRVVLRIEESIVTSNNDSTLLDPAQGANNYAAPGADRLKIDLILEVLDYDSIIDDNYVELMRYNAGVLEEHVRHSQYSELEKNLARRTFDQSGDYVVEGFNLDIRESLRTSTNNGVAFDGNPEKLVYEVTPGKCYIKGFESESIATRRVEVDKARTPDHVETLKVTLPVQFGQYIIVADVEGILKTELREEVKLFDQSTQIGTCNSVALDYLAGDGSTYPVYKLYITNLQLDANKSLRDVGRASAVSGFSAKLCAEYTAPISSGKFDADDVVKFNESEPNEARATVAFYDVNRGRLYAWRTSVSHPMPRTGNLIIGPSAQSTIRNTRYIVQESQTDPGCIKELPFTGTRAVRDATNSYDISYTKFVRLEMPQGGSQTTPPIAGEILPPEVGTFVAVSSTGPVAVDDFKLGPGSTTIELKAGTAPSIISIYCQVQVSGGQARTKTVATANNIPKPSTREIALDHVDVFDLMRVESGGVDITRYYELDTNADKYDYYTSKIRVKSGITVPPGSVTISYRYFNHAQNGDYFSIDSYIGIDPEDIPSITTSNGESVSLRDCIDFRRSIGTQSDIIVPDTIIFSSVQRYLPRVDSICIDKNHQVLVVSGRPSVNPTPRKIPADTLELYQVIIPPYTFDLKALRPRRVATIRYTMQDIKNVERRIDRLEDFSTLTAVESNLIETEFIDAETGLDRYKTGFLVEDVRDPFKIANYDAPEFRATMQANSGITPNFEYTPIMLDIQSGAYQQTGSIITLPYTEVAYIDIKVSSRTENLNPFLLISWNGRCFTYPQADVWTTSSYADPIYNKVTTNINVSSVKTKETTVNVNKNVRPKELAGLGLYTPAEAQKIDDIMHNRVKPAAPPPAPIIPTLAWSNTFQGFGYSDRRLKENIKLVDYENGYNIYEFNYIADPTHTYRGVIADEVKITNPHAVNSIDGYDCVNYSMLGIQMTCVRGE